MEMTTLILMLAVGGLAAAVGIAFFVTRIPKA